VLLPLTNDSDVDGHPLTIIEINGVALTPGTAQTIPVTNGTVTVSASGVITFTPTAGYTGTVTFPYTISDGHGGTVTADISVVVTNIAPVAVDDTSTTLSDVPVVVNVLSNDTDANGDPLTITQINGVTPVVGTPIVVPNGTVTLNADGTLTVTPDAGYTGVVTFPYTVSDGNGGTDTGSVSVTVVESTPTTTVVVNDDAVSTVSGTPVSLNPLQNDVTSGLDPITVVSINGVTLTPGTAQTIPVPNGVVTVSATGEIVFTPNPGFVGTVTIPYVGSDGVNTDSGVVTVTVTNTAPVVADDGADTIMDTPVTLDVLTNDYDANGSTLTITQINGVTPVVGTPITVPNGTVTLNADGTLTVTPDAGYIGVITFPYTVSDGNGGTDTAQVTVTVQTGTLAANTDSYVSEPGVPVVLDLLGNDVGTGLTVTSINGVTITTGTAQTITVPNGTVTVSVAGVITFTPTAGYTGPITFPYTITDGSGSTDTANVNLTIVNNPPVALNDLAYVGVNGSVVITPLVNDTDANGQILTVTSINGTTLTYTPNTTQTISTTNGTVTITYSSAGVATITYIPNTNYVGTEIIAYTISDGHGGVANAQMVVVVGNLAPIAVNDTVQVVQGNSVVINPLENDSDPDGQVIKILEINGVVIVPGTLQTIKVPNGVVNVSIDGKITLTPNPEFVGAITFNYKIVDVSGKMGSGTIRVDVTPKAIAKTGIGYNYFLLLAGMFLVIISTIKGISTVRKC